MTTDKKFEILIRKLAQCNDLANKLQVNINWPITIAARSVIAGHRKQFAQQLEFILTPPETSALQ
jgi:hypothetical protein